MLQYLILVRFYVLHGPLVLEDEGKMYLRNVNNHLSNDAASHPSRSESSVRFLWKPQTPCVLGLHTLGSNRMWVSALRYSRCTKGIAVAAEEKLTDPVSNRSLAGEAI
jgi:hypothetical protein